MTERTNLTVPLSADTQARLSKLAASTQRDQRALGAEAIAAFVERELAIVEGIEQGLDDMRNGRTVPHEDAMNRIRAIAGGSKNGR